MEGVMRVGVVAAAFLALPSLASASVEIRKQGALVSVHSQAAPLADVLAQLSRELGMKVVYDGAPPRTLVNASIENRTPAEAVLGVLEGLGLNFLARMNLAGTRIEHLVISGSAPVGGAAAPPASTGTNRPAAARDEDADDEEEEPAGEEKPVRQRPGMLLGDRARPALSAAPSMLPATPTNPNPSYPVSPFAPLAPAPPTVVAPPPPAEAPEEPEDDEAILQ